MTRGATIGSFENKNKNCERNICITPTGRKLCKEDTTTKAMNVLTAAAAKQRSTHKILDWLDNNNKKESQGPLLHYWPLKKTFLISSPLLAGIPIWKVLAFCITNPKLKSDFQNNSQGGGGAGRDTGWCKKFTLCASLNDNKLFCTLCAFSCRNTFFLLAIDHGKEKYNKERQR